jgi:hypothetical protein
LLLIEHRTLAGALQGTIVERSRAHGCEEGVRPVNAGDVEHLMETAPYGCADPDCELCATFFGSAMPTDRGEDPTDLKRDEATERKNDKHNH